MFLKGPERPIRLNLPRDAEVTQNEGVLTPGLVEEEDGVVYFRHQLRRVCGVCRRRCRRPYMRAAALDAGGPDVGDAAHARLKSLFGVMGGVEGRATHSAID